MRTETTIAGMMLKLARDPGTKNRGPKAAMVVRTAKVTGTAISWAPSMAAVVGSLPCSIFSQAFSPTTMASSTTMPRVTMSAKG